MVVQLKPQVTFEEFEAFVNLPENSEGRFELIDGEIVEVPSNPFVSVIAGLIAYALHRWLHETKSQGYITGEGGGFIINGQVFAPDAAYVRTLPASKGYEPAPPVLAVEVISDPHNNAEQTDLRRKIAHYMIAGVVVWVVDYVARKVEVHTPNALVQVLGEADKLTGGAALPGFELEVKTIFPDTAPEQEG